MKKNIFLLLLLGSLLTACDPAQTLELVNKSTEESTVKIYFKGDLSGQLEEFQTKDSLVVKLAPNESEVFHFGIGTWKVNNAIDSLVSRIQKIEIVTETSTQIFQGETQVGPFLKGILEDSRYKSQLIIELE